MHFILVSAEGKWVFWYTIGPDGYHFDKREPAYRTDPQWFKDQGYTAMMGRNGIHYLKLIEL